MHKRQTLCTHAVCCTLQAGRHPRPTVDRTPRVMVNNGSLQQGPDGEKAGSQAEALRRMAGLNVTVMVPQPHPVSHPFAPRNAPRQGDAAVVVDENGGASDGGAEAVETSAGKEPEAAAVVPANNSKAVPTAEAAAGAAKETCQAGQLAASAGVKSVTTPGSANAEQRQQGNGVAEKEVTPLTLTSMLNKVRRESGWGPEGRKKKGEV